MLGMVRTGVIAWILAACGLAGAGAQLPVGLPDLPDERVGDILREPVDEIRRTRGDIEDLRRDTLDRLLRQNRDVLEPGPDRTVIVRSQITRLGPSGDLAPLLGAGFTVLSERPLSALDLSLQVLQAPDGLSTVRALTLARQLDPGATYDFNHLYSRSGQAGPVTYQPVSRPGQPVRVGLIDTGVDAAHPGLVHFALTPQAFHAGDYRVQPHGSSVALLMAQHLPGGELVSADVYGDGPTGGSVEGLVSALAWMAEMRVGVVNVSLVGPPNQVLEQAVAAMSRRGIVLVAAVGNDGPSADPLYPAAYPGVIGVTGVRENGRVLPEACRGAHVDIAALGDHRQSGLPGGQGRVRGTSFAAPLISAWLAPGFPDPAPDAVLRAEASLSEAARDAGRRGRDAVYGFGIVDLSPQFVMTSEN